VTVFRIFTPKPMSKIITARFPLRDAFSSHDDRRTSSRLSRALSSRDSPDWKAIPGPRNVTLSQGQIGDLKDAAKSKSLSLLHRLNFGAVGQLFICPRVS
jgi:hypothetical protein